MAEEKRGKAAGRSRSRARSFWRANYLDLEVRLAVLAGWLVIIALLTGGLSTYLVVWSRLLALPHLAASEAMIEMHRQILRGMALTFSLMVLLLVTLAALIQYRVLHRITGPVSRVEKVLREMSAGNLPARPLAFRRKDFLSGLAGAVNDLAAAIRSGREFR